MGARGWHGADLPHVPRRAPKTLRVLETLKLRTLNPKPETLNPKEVFGSVPSAKLG